MFSFLSIPIILLVISLKMCDLSFGSSISTSSSCISQVRHPVFHLPLSLLSLIICFPNVVFYAAPFDLCRRVTTFYVSFFGHTCILYVFFLRIAIYDEQERTLFNGFFCCLKVDRGG